MKCASDGDKITSYGEAVMGIEVLVLAFGIYAVIWVAVLAGSRFFGPR